MVIKAKTDQVIAIWPISWKVWLNTTQPATASTSGKETTIVGKEKEDKKCIRKDAENDVEKEAKKDTELELEEEVELDLGGTNKLDGIGAESPR